MALQVAGNETKKNVAYELAATENPGAVIAQVQFNGDNFDEWAQAVRTALRFKKKYRFVDGSVKKPEEDDEQCEDWMSAKSMVALWILNTVDPKVRKTLGNKEDPADLWKEIKDRFSEGNGPRIQEIKAELACCRQGNLSVIDYYGKLQMLWDDLKNYYQVAKCKCGGCTCNLNTELEKKREEDRIHQFLLGLNNGVYGSVQSSIISTDPLPNLNQVYAKVKSVERIGTMMRGTEVQGAQMAFQTRAGNVNLGSEDKNKLFCSSCKKKGNVAETCFQLIGYPIWWVEKGRGGGRGEGRGTGRGRGVVRANATMVLGNTEPSAEAEKSGELE